MQKKKKPPKTEQWSLLSGFFSCPRVCKVKKIKTTPGRVSVTIAEQFLKIKGRCARRMWMTPNKNSTGEFSANRRGPKEKRKKKWATQCRRWTHLHNLLILSWRAVLVCDLSNGKEMQGVVVQSSCSVSIEGETMNLFFGTRLHRQKVNRRTTTILPRLLPAPPVFLLNVTSRLLWLQNKSRIQGRRFESMQS
jgi:hypothetical protein